MIRRGIRSQLLFIAIAPSILVAMLLTVAFLSRGVSDLSEAHRQRAQALTRLLAANAEFGLFAGDQSALQALANAVLREHDVVGVSILDRGGRVLVTGGQPGIPLPAKLEDTDAAREFEQGSRHLVVQRVAVGEISTDPLFDTAAVPPKRSAELLGYVALELSSSGLRELELTLVLAGILATAGGLAFGILLAVRLSRDVSVPLLALARTVQRVERGDLEARVPVDRTSPLRGLEEGVNRMAASIQQSRDDLERRIAAATAALRQKKEEAEEANIAKSRFVATASHDLRQPMHALGLFVDGLRDEVGTLPRPRQLLESMRHSLDAMTAMFDALLDLSRLDAGAVAVNRIDFPIATLLAQMEEMFAPQAARRGLRFGVVASGAWVNSDYALLARVVQNLVSNALTHTREGGVVLGCRRRAGVLRIEVWDTGPGIALEHQQDVFKEYFQLGNPERDRSRGLGLGLAIVDKIARMLGHALQLRSIPGRGSVFSIDVPRGEVQRSEAQPTQLELIADNFTGACIAVLDDDAASVEAMTVLLDTWGCTVAGAGSAEALLHELESRALLPDLLLFDYRLRDGRTGIQAVAQVRGALGRDVPAVLVTGDTAADRLAEAQASGLALVHKPVAPATLRNLLRENLLPAGTGARAAAVPGPAAPGEHS